MIRKWKSMAEKKLISATELVIGKASLTVQGIAVEAYELYSYDDGTSTEEPFTRSFKREPHPDLIEAFDALRDHVGAICGIDPKHFDKIKVTGIRITDLNGEQPKGMVLAKMSVIDSQALSLNTPFLHLENTAYGNRRELAKLLIEAEQEVRLYILSNKVATPTLWEQGKPKVVA